MEGRIGFSTSSLGAPVRCSDGTEGGTAEAVDLDLVRRCDVDDVDDDDDDDDDDDVFVAAVLCASLELEDLIGRDGVLGGFATVQ